MAWRTDPDVNLNETLALAQQVLANAGDDVQHLDAARLAPLVLALETPRPTRLMAPGSDQRCPLQGRAAHRSDEDAVMREMVEDALARSKGD